MFDNEPSIFSFFKKGNRDNHDCKKNKKKKKKGQRRLDHPSARLLPEQLQPHHQRLCGEPPSSVACHHTLIKLVVAELRETSKNKRYLADCYKKSITFHSFVMDAHVRKYLPQRTYSDLPHKRLEYVPVNWAAPQCRDLLGFNTLSLTTCGKGNTYKVKYLADLYHIPCTSSTSPVTCWTHTQTIFHRFQYIVFSSSRVLTHT